MTSVPLIRLFDDPRRVVSAVRLNAPAAPQAATAPVTTAFAGAPTPVPSTPDDTAERDPRGEALAGAAWFWFGHTAAAPAMTAARLRAFGDGGLGSVAPDVAKAAERLGVGPRASQAEIDMRFREIVKAERPDLGLMDADDLSALTEARRTLSAEARHARHVAAEARWSRGGGAGTGTVIDLRA